jgi:hypothetical protein
VKVEITGDARSKLMAIGLTHIRGYLKTTALEAYVRYFCACRLFNRKQGNVESIVSWGSRLDVLQTDLREAAKRV